MPGTPRRLTIIAAILAIAAAVVTGCSSRGGGVVNDTPSTPASGEPVGPSAEAARIVKGLADEDLVGQVLMPSVNLSDAPAGTAALVRQYHLGGLILMGDVENTAAGGTAAQVKALTDAVRSASHGLGGITADPLLGTDQEYGWVTRIKSGVVQLPSGMAFGAAGRPELTQAAWRAAGSELAAIGINVDFAPDADVVSSPGNTVIGSRSFGANPTAVSGQVGAAVRGLQSAGLAAALKHFPGHGHTDVNSHEALPVLTQSKSALDSGDLPPFRAGIEAGAMMIMSGHLDVQSIDPGVPASFSHKVLVDLLRNQLKFDGVVVTDALNMAPAVAQGSPGDAAVKALVAGNDLLLMPPDLPAAQQGLLGALHSGQLPRQRLVEAATRVVALRLRLTTSAPASPVDTAANAQAARQAAAAAITVLKGSCAGPLVTGDVRVTAATGREQQAQWLADALRAQGVNVVAEGGQVVHLVGYGDGADDLAPDAAVTVAMDTPFLLESSVAPVRMATYSSTQVAMDSLAAVLTGKAAPTGKSPVPLPTLPPSACTP
jgi:beta-N-acetylhexosaminidase